MVQRKLLQVLELTHSGSARIDIYHSGVRSDIKDKFKNEKKYWYDMNICSLTGLPYFYPLKYIRFCIMPQSTDLS